MSIHKKIFLLITTCMFLSESFAQMPKSRFFRANVNGLSIEGGFAAGDMVHGYSFTHHGDILSRKHIHYDGYNQGTGIGQLTLKYRFKNKFAIESGFIYSDFGYGFMDKNFENKVADPKYAGEFNFDIIYAGVSLCGYYYLPLTPLHAVSLIISPGVNFNFNANAVSDNTYTPPYYVNNATQVDALTNQQLDLTIQGKQYFTQYFIQSGFAFSILRFNLNLVARYNFSQNMLSGDYQNSHNGIINYTDHLNASCNFFSCHFVLGFMIFQEKDKEEDTHLKFRTTKYEKNKFKTKYIKPRY